jgi:hypothetical protein
MRGSGRGGKVFGGVSGAVRARCGRADATRGQRGALRRARRISTLQADELAVHPLGVGAAQSWITGVVGTHRVPGVAQSGYVARKDPGSDVNARAGVEEVVLGDPVASQRRQPRGVDLHESDVARAVTVVTHGRGIQTRFGAGDRVEQVAAQPVAGRSLIPARPRWHRDEQPGDRQRYQRAAPYRIARRRMRAACDGASLVSFAGAGEGASPMASIVGSAVTSVWSNQDLREVLIGYCAALALMPAIDSSTPTAASARVG